MTIEGICMRSIYILSVQCINVLFIIIIILNALRTSVPKYRLMRFAMDAM